MSKGKKLARVVHRNKSLLLLFSFFLSLLLIIGSTYAWHTYSDERLNRVKENKGKLDVVIAENFNVNLSFEPGTRTEKELTVKNIGKSPAIVRVSLYEFFLAFEIDLNVGEGKGNGKLKTVNHSNGSDIDLHDLNTWEVGNTYPVAAGNYFVATDVFKSDTNNATTAYRYKEPPTYLALQSIIIDFNTEKIVTTIPTEETSNYWYYEAGYFYYSEMLNAGESTEKLIQSVHLPESYPNKYKGALYQLIPVMDAHDISKSLLKDWQIAGTAVEAMYRGKLN